MAIKKFETQDGIKLQSDDAIVDSQDNSLLVGDGTGGLDSSIENNNNTLSIDANGNAVFDSTEGPGGVNRGLVWNYGEGQDDGTNSTVRQDNFGLSVKAWTEGDGGGPTGEGPGYSATVNIRTNQGDNEKWWTFDGAGNLTLPEGGDIVDSNGASVLGGGVTGDSNVWIQTFETQEGAPTDIPSVAISVEYDSAGNVIALFNHYNNITNSTYYSVGKYTTAGAKIWTARFSDDFFTDGWGLAVDNDTDTIYVAGETTPESGYGLSTLTKLDATDGSVVWSKTYDFGYYSSSAVVDVASDGNPVMVGYAGNGSDRYVATTKVSAADGSITWSRSLDGQNDEEAYGMAVGPDGEIVVIGYMSQLGIIDGAATLYTDPVSNANWTINQTGVFSGSGGVGITFDVSFTAGAPTFTNISDTAGDRTVDGTVATILGSVLGGADGIDDMVVKVGTLSVNDTDDRMLVVKYDSTGSIQWQKAILFDAEFNCKGADADIDSNGNIYVTGSYQYSFDGGTTSALSILKLDGNGAKQWSRRVQGDCDTFGVSVVVGADDKLYLSGMTGDNNNINNGYTWVAAKYDFNGLVEWQRLIDNTTGWSFVGGIFYGNGGGSNIAVKQDYVLLGGGFGDLINSGVPHATLVQVSATGDTFALGDWDFKAASFSGVLNNTASDITVANAGKTDTDNAENITTSTVTLETDTSSFLLGTLYAQAVGNDRLVNSGNQLVLESTGAVTLPDGGTISEGYVTSNPTIQLTPASPTVASQKLVIKGGGNYSNTENGITVTVNNITQTVGDVINVYVDSVANADQTLYWWIYPESAGLADPGTGTVILDEFGDGNFTFELDSDDYEFTVRVSPEDNNYDPDNTGAESVLINGDAPTFNGEHHLHLTTGDLTETSIFLGTDNHNVRTTVDGKIQITTPSEGNNVWEFGTDGAITFPTLTVPISDNATPSGTGQTLKFSDSTQQAIIFGPASTTDNNSAERIIIQGAPGYTGTDGEGGDVYVWAGPGGDTNGSGGDIKVRAGRGNGTGSGGYLNFQAGDSGTGNGGWINIEGGQSNTYGNGGDVTVQAHDGGEIFLRTHDSITTQTWTLGATGTTTFPGALVKSTVAKTGANITGNNVLFEVTAVDGSGTVTEITVTNSPNPAWVTGTSGIALGDVDFTVSFDGAGNASVVVNNGGTGHSIGQAFELGPEAVGGTIPTPTALDLTKSINKLADGYYSLANGVEGQIMYLVRQTGSNDIDITVQVANARVSGSTYTDYPHYPFSGGSSQNVTILIFTDGAWQSNNGGWD